MVSASAGTGGALSSAVAQDQADDDGWDAEGVDVPQSPAAAPGGNIYRGGQQQHGASATSSATGGAVGAVGGTGGYVNGSMFAEREDYATLKRREEEDARMASVAADADVAGVVEDMIAAIEAPVEPAFWMARDDWYDIAGKERWTRELYTT